MADPLDTVNTKVMAIFHEFFGDRAKRLDGTTISEPARSKVADALADENGRELAEKLAFHMTDWNWDAAFIVALHVFPERFTPEEIDAGIGLFLCHAPNHIRAACQITGNYVWEDFPEDDEGEEG
jgi:hypothetical protein